jgi:PAS domain S-box-containing protein
MRLGTKIGAGLGLGMLIIGVEDIRSCLGIQLDTQNRIAAEVARRTIWTAAVGVLFSLLVLSVAAVAINRTMRLADRATPSGSAGRKWSGIAVRCAFAVAAVAFAGLLRWWLIQSFGPMPLFVTFYPSILLVATIAGGGPGILTTLLSALVADYWFIAPIGFGIAATNDAVATGIFTGTGIFLSILAERMRRARWAEAVSVTQEKELALLDKGNLLTLTMDHRIVRWSQGCRRLYGFDAREAQGRLTHELLQTHFPQPLEQIHRTLLEQDHWEGEVTRRRKDGADLSLAILWALRRDERGSPLDILEVSTDITRQKAAENAMQQQAEELAQQNEELSRQSEELLGQNEELQNQSEEIQALNADLTQREKMLETLLDSSRLPIGEQEFMGKICHAALGMIGQGADAAVVFEQHGDELKVMAHAGFDGADVPRSWPVKGSFVEIVIRQNRTASLEDTLLRPDLNILQVPGRERFAAILSAPLQVHGKPIGAVSAYGNRSQQWTTEQFRLIEWLAAQCSNILEALRLQAEAREAGQHRRLALEAAELGAWNYHFESGNVYWDERCRNMWGIPKGDEIDYAAAIDRIHPEDRTATDEAVKQALAGANGGAYHREFRVVWPDGSVHWIASHGRVHFEGEGEDRRAVQFVGTNREITQEKRAEEAIRASQLQNEFLASVVELSSQAFGVGYPDGHVGLLNKAFEQLTGYAGDELRSIDWARVLTPPEWLEIEREKLRELHRTGLPVRYEKEYIRKNGTRVPIELLVHLVKDQDGKPLYYYSFINDITERRRREENLRRTAEELVRSNKELEQFAYVTSHDLQEPLRQVQAFVQLLRERHRDKFDGQAAQYMRFVYDGAARMSELVRDLLAYSRVGAPELRQQPTACQQALDTALVNLQTSISESHARITCDELPTVMVVPAQLRQLFQNLVGNAIKFRHEGVAPEVHVGARRDGDQWLLWVKDNGIGISPEHHERVFLIFQRLHGRENYPGTGIGLAICKKIIEHHGGRIWVESKPGEGTTFFFFLPGGGIA